MIETNTASYFRHYLAAHDQALNQTEVTDSFGNSIEPQDGIDKLCSWSLEIRNMGKRQHMVGNGASMAFANHMALDWTKNGGVTSHCYASPSLLTAILNDLGVDETFAAAINWYAEPEDLLVTVSTSGNSPNILKSIEKAREKTMRVVTFSGLRPDNKSRILGDLNFYVPAKTYGIVECAHQVLLHLWLDQFLGVKEWDREHYQNMRQTDYQL